ncbi:hypothetical protein AB0I81_50930 [Nonomuraea sp. NPDC050404]|uniref:hypothetical protein n=1 Tax=Nonomuraea sp. NPDC050404 TaxID=3155783 RepID=UPI0033E33660
MDDPRQPGSLPSPGKEGRSFDWLTREKITATRQAFYTAAAKAIFALQNGRRLYGEHLFATAHAQAARAWWDLVDEEVTGKKLACDHAVRRVRSWARHYLTTEPPVARPGTLFDHALAHAARMAARDFLTDSSHLLTQHLIGQADTLATSTATAVEHDHDPRPVSPDAPPSMVAGL